MVGGFIHERLWSGSYQKLRDLSNRVRLIHGKSFATEQELEGVLADLSNIKTEIPLLREEFALQISDIPMVYKDMIVTARPHQVSVLERQRDQLIQDMEAFQLAIDGLEVGIEESILKCRKYLEHLKR